MIQVYLDIIDDFIRDGEGGKPVARLVGELLREKDAEIARLNAEYNKLIMAVARKYPGETRHETALRYIHEAETLSNEPAKHVQEATDDKR